jgi:hypothetical protein
MILTMGIIIPENSSTLDNIEPIHTGNEMNE